MKFSYIYIKQLLINIIIISRHCKKFGTQAWIVIGIIATELCIILKFDWNLVTTPVPRYIAYIWIAGLAILILWTIWHFYLQRLLWHTEKKIQKVALQGTNKKVADGSQQKRDTCSGDVSHNNNKDFYTKSKYEPKSITSRRTIHSSRDNRNQHRKDS